MVEKGIGISLLPHLAIRRELRQGTLATVSISDARPLSRYVDFVYRRRSTLSEIARTFRHHVQTVYHALDGENAAAATSARGG
jgi:DNA-binding transcriptional LysR family regulator